MRNLRRPEHLSRDELEGTLSPRPLVPTISGRSKHELFGGLSRLEPMSLGYVSWTAFLVFWVVFGRVTLLYSMTVGGLVPFPRTGGLSITVQDVRLTGGDLDDLLESRRVSQADGVLELNTTDYVVRHLRVDPDRVLRTTDGEWSGQMRKRLCTDAQATARRPVVFVTMGEGSSYQDMVSAVDRIVAEEDRTCLIDVRFTYSEP